MDATPQTDGEKIMRTYNGWTNRETWVVALHLSNAVYEIFEDRIIDEDAAGYKYRPTIGEIVDTLEELFTDQLPLEDTFIMDLIDTTSVDFKAIAITIRYDLIAAFKYQEAAA